MDRLEHIKKSAVIKRSILINGHKTSVSLENEFWLGLQQTWTCALPMSAFGGKADVARTVEDTPPARQSSYSIEMSFPV